MVQYTIRYGTGQTDQVVKSHKTGGGQWQFLGTYNLVDGNDYVEVTSSSNKFVADAIRWVHTPEPIVTNVASTLFIHADHLGTPRQATDDSGTVVWRWDSRPFGDSAPDEDPDGDQSLFSLNLRFPGQYYDSESGLHYNYFRTYDPQIGRYVESDPVGLEAGFNTFVYALANPIGFSDALGLDVFICTRPVNVSWIPRFASEYIVPDHTWILTDSREAGMGGQCPVPGQGCADSPYVTEVQITDHSGQSAQNDSSCMLMHNVDEQCVNDELELGRPLGNFNPFNNCQSFAWSVIQKCRLGPQEDPNLGAQVP